MKLSRRTPDHWILRVGLAGLVPLAQFAAAAATNRAPVAVWDVSARGETGAGYRHNVTLTSFTPESSAFVAVAADASFIRLSETGSELTMFFLGQDMQYFDVPSVDGERYASGTVQLARPLGPVNKIGIEFNALYVNQVMDLSETETNLAPTQVEGVGLSLKPKWTQKFRPGWELRLEGIGGQQLYSGDVDSYWEAGGRLGVARVYANRSEVSLNYQSLHWLYDNREQTDEQGNAIPGTSLAFWRPELFGQWRQTWDAQRQWVTTTKVGWLWNLDNGSGYWNYNRLVLGQKVRWRQGPWEVAAGARFGWYFYSVQTVGNEKRGRSYTSLDLRVERLVGKHWFVYASGESSWNWSNESFDRYSDWTIGAGVGVSF